MGSYFLDFDDANLYYTVLYYIPLLLTHSLGAGLEEHVQTTATTITIAIPI
jgi:hypothetical protein